MTRLRSPLRQASTLKMPAADQPSPTEARPPVDFINKSPLYREFLAEREEILRLKWIESEKAGRDIGFERALLDWIRYHRDEWRDARRTVSTSRAS